MYQNRIYLASPFFSPEQKERINQVVKALKQNPTIDPTGIYLPEDHQDDSLPFGSHKWQDSVFHMDMRQVKRADVVVAITDYKHEENNPEPDSGTIFEVGAAWAWHIPIVLVQFHPNNQLNLMLARSHTAMFTGETAPAELAKYDFNNLPTHWTDMEVF